MLLPSSFYIIKIFLILYNLYGLLEVQFFIILGSLFHCNLVLGFFVLCSYKSLDVKNILLETVSHHILPQMLASPLWGDLDDLLREYLKFMDDHFRESADLTFLAYRHRNYSKVRMLLEVCCCIYILLLISLSPLSRISLYAKSRFS